MLNETFSVVFKHRAVLKKCGKIQNVVSSFDFEMFSPEIHALGAKIQIFFAALLCKLRLPLFWVFLPTVM